METLNNIIHSKPPQYVDNFSIQCAKWRATLFNAPTRIFFTPTLCKGGGGDPVTHSCTPCISPTRASILFFVTHLDRSSDARRRLTARLQDPASPLPRLGADGTVDLGAGLAVWRSPDHAEARAKGATATAAAGQEVRRD